MSDLPASSSTGDHILHPVLLPRTAELEPRLGMLSAGRIQVGEGRVAWCSLMSLGRETRRKKCYQGRGESWEWEKSRRGGGTAVGFVPAWRGFAGSQGKCCFRVFFFSPELLIFFRLQNPFTSHVLKLCESFGSGEAIGGWVGHPKGEAGSWRVAGSVTNSWLRSGVVGSRTPKWRHSWESAPSSSAAAWKVVGSTWRWDLPRDLLHATPPELVEGRCGWTERGETETEWAGADLNNFGFFPRLGKVEKLLAGRRWGWGCWIWGAESP